MISWKESNMDLFSKIKNEHVMILRTLDELVGSDPETRKEKINDLSIQIIAHMDAEERSIYTAFEEVDPIARSLALRSGEEHSLSRYMMNRLREKGIEPEYWAARLQVLQNIVRNHIEEEERTMFDIALDHFNEEEIGSMTKKFEDVENGLLSESRIRSIKSA